MSIFTHTKLSQAQLQRAKERMKQQTVQSGCNGNHNMAGNDPCFNAEDPAERGRHKRTFNNEGRNYSVKNH